MEITELTLDLIGKKISCEIRGDIISEGEIYFAKDNYYILQNIKDGGHDKHVKDSKTKYKYGWCILKGLFTAGGLSEVFLLNTEPTYEIY